MQNINSNINSNSLMSFEKLQVFGNVPLPRFGHSITAYSQGKICLFGGATGTTGQFSITDNTYTLDMSTKFWKKIQTSGTSPSARAAHGAVCIEPYKIVIFGGATGSGGLASDDLYHLDIRDGVGVWNVINVSHKTPGKRYGHTFSYTKPYLIVFGGNIGEKSVNDCWILNIQKPPLVWTQVKCESQSPPPRVYHSAALCQSGTASGMVVIFGGRGTDNNPLGDSWGLRRHRKGHWDWVKAPEKTTPSARYQHSSIFIGSLMLVIGGRTNNVSEQLPLEVFDTQTSDWISFNSLQRFRCGTWFYENFIYIYGGFDLATPNVPTDSIYRLNLNTLFANNISLKAKLGAGIISDKKSMENSSSQDNTRPNSSDSKGPSTPVMKGGVNRSVLSRQQNKREFFPKQQVIKPSKIQTFTKEQMIKPKTQKRRRIKMLQPVMGNSSQLRPQYDIKRPLTTKADLPHYFLNQLLQPKRFMNAQAIDIYFKPQHIQHLCNMAQEVIVNQPMILTPKTPLKIFGDIHGQFTDLMSFFELYGTPHENGKKKDIQNYDYVFLGDFVDRGSHSLETICLLLALKCVYPDQIHLIRGNHEDSQINVNFGFRDQCADKISQQQPQDENSVFNRINRLFDWLPLAANIQDRILCLHGGIGASLETLADIQNIKRPLEVMHEVQDEESQIVLDILWSDPTESDSQLGIIPNHLRDPSQTGNIVKFGPDRVQQFLKKNNLNMIIRAHECVMDGFQRFANGSLITVFSATDYCRKHKNAGAILIVKTNYQIIPKLIYPSNTNANNWIQDQQQLRRRPPTPPRWRSNQGRN